MPRLTLRDCDALKGAASLRTGSTRILVGGLAVLALVACSKTGDKREDPLFGGEGPPEPVIAEFESSEVEFDHVKKQRKRLKAKAKKEGVSAKKLFVQNIKSTPSQQIERSSPKIREGLELIRDKLLAAWPPDVAKPPPLPIVVMDTRGYNATASSVGGISISLGIIKDCVAGAGTAEKECPTQDDLAFIIAHELAHYYGNHFAEDAFRENMKKAAANVVKMIAAVESMAENGGDTDVARKAAIAYKIYGALDKHVLSPAFSRGQEKEADRLAVDMMHRAGFVPTRAKTVLQRMKASREKAKELNQKAKQEGKSQRLLASMVGEALSEISRTHPNFKERRQSLFPEYLVPVYIDTGKLKSPDTTPAGFLIAMRNNPSQYPIARAVAIRQAQESYLNGDVDKAESRVLRALEGKWDPNPRARELLAEIRLDQDEPGTAIINLERAACHPEPPRFVFERLEALYRQHGETSEVLQAMAWAVAVHGPTYRLHPERAAELFDAGRKADLLAELRQCAVHGGPAQRRACLKKLAALSKREGEPRLDPGDVRRIKRLAAFMQKTRDIDVDDDVDDGKSAASAEDSGDATGGAEDGSATAADTQARAAEMARNLDLPSAVKLARQPLKSKAAKLALRRYRAKWTDREPAFDPQPASRLDRCQPGRKIIERRREAGLESLEPL